MRFTTQQYDKAIQALIEGKEQLNPDGKCCSICGDSGHMAWECGHNPLLAMEMCSVIAKSSNELHEHLHYLAGHDWMFGVQHGPAAIVPPDTQKE